MIVHIETKCAAVQFFSHCYYFVPLARNAGLKLLQIISRTSEGWKQISAVHAGWQSIVAGTIQGDALVHDLPGEFNNPGTTLTMVVSRSAVEKNISFVLPFFLAKQLMFLFTYHLLTPVVCVYFYAHTPVLHTGWAIGDTPYLPLLARQKLAAAKLAQSGIQAEPRAAWTPSSLREYMGLSMAGQTLAINTEHHNIYYELLCTLDMLPKVGEEREHWFQRVHAYEVENEVKIEDMVGTVQEMRRREAVHKKAALKGIALGENDEILGTVKDVFVNGQRITGDILQSNDVDVDEALQGVL